MPTSPLSWSRSFLSLFFLAFLGLATAHGQSRITQTIDNRIRATLTGNVHPLAQPQYDRGAVPDSFSVERMFLLLQRPPDREAALRQFLEDAHHPGSGHYHKWLTPEQFGELYGPDDSEVATVAAWLQSQGLVVSRITKGKTAIEFSGDAGHLRKAFNTEIHTYSINGEEHHANSRDPQIPAALASVVAGITPLNDFHPKSFAEVVGTATYDVNTKTITPDWTVGTLPLLFLGPGDFDIQYDLNPVYSSGLSGTGVTIGIIGASNVDPSEVATYRSLFGLPTLNFNVVLDGTDPGQNGAVVESYLDVEVSGAVAPGAAINLYTAADTTVQSGLYLAAQRAVDDDQATVLSTSYGTCEQYLGSSGNQFWAAVWEQAAAQGQTSFVSAGDGGSAGCDDFDYPQSAQLGLAVNGFASTPWNIAVGGTDFYYTSYNGTASQQQTQLATYWNLTPTNLPAISILKTVPEQVWNRAFGLNLSTGGIYSAIPPTIIAGSGGVSSCVTGTASSSGGFATCTAGYSKPSWQSGTGVPADQVRDLPDVSLFAAAGENNSMYAICAGPGQCVEENGGIGFTGVGGTSASSPAMAGIMALINQKYGPQGQANFTLYPLAAQHPTAFHDITTGSDVVPCEPGTPNCALSSVNDNTSGFYTLGAYYTGAGYDLASGLGSVDANLLIKNWNSLTFKPTTTKLSLSQTTFPHGTPVNVSVGVTGSGGTPSGDVALVSTASPTPNTGLGEITLQSGAASSTINSLPGGQYQLTAHYGGDSIFASSNSNSMAVNVSAENSTTALSGTYYDFATNVFAPISNGGTYPYGSYIVLDAQPRGVNAPSGSTDGIATGTMSFTDTASDGNVSSGPLSLDRQGLAEWIPSPELLAGSHSLSARYSGDPSFNPSSSTPPLAFTITKATPTAGLSASPNPAGQGAPVTITLSVGIGGNVTPPTGTATFSYNGTQTTSTLSPQAYSSYAAASVTTSSLPIGTDSITASYGGDSNYTAATAAPANVVIMQNANLTASISPSPVNLTQSFTVTGTVTGASGQPAPTGSLYFYAVGSGNTWGAGGTLVNGSASFTYPAGAFGPGNVSVQVQYLGDSVYAPSTVTVNVAVTVPFTMSASAVTIASPGATTNNTSSITISPEGGFTGTVGLSCSLTSSPTGAQDLPTCTVTPQITVSGANPVAATMTVNSTAPTSAALVPVRSGPRWLAAEAGVLAAGFVVVSIPFRRRGRGRFAGGLFLMVVLIALAACGGGGSGSGGGGGGGGNPGTTPGNYTFTITGSISSTNTAQATAAVTIQ